MAGLKKQFTEFYSSPLGKSAWSEGKALKLLASFSLFYAVIEILAIAGSLVHLPIFRSGALIIIILAGVFAIIYWRRLRESQSAGPLSSPGAIATGFFILTLVLYLVLWILAYALPDFSYDGNYYHTPSLHFWTQKGYIHWINPGPSPHWGPVVTFAWNGYPKAVEVVGYIFLQGIACSRLLNSLNLLFLPLGVLALISLALTLGAPAGFALAAGCLFLYLPINLAQSLTAMVDTGSAACYLAFFALLLGTVKRIDAGKIPWGLLAGLSSALGLAVGSKGPGLALIPAGGLVLLVRIYIARRRIRRKLQPGSNAPPPLRRPLGFVIFTILLALGVGGFWGGRNWLRTGNPFYPAAISWAGYDIFSGVDLSLQFRPPYRAGTEDWSQMERVLSNWLGCFRFGDPEVLVYDSRRGGLGFAWLLSIPAVLGLLYVCVARRKKPETGGISYLPDLVFLCLVMFFVMPRNHNHMSRYTIWLAGLGLPCLAVVTGGAVAAAGKNRWKKYAGYAWLGAVCLLAGRETIASLRLHLSFLDMFRGKEASAICPLRVLRAARSPYPAGYYWNDLNGTIFEMIMTGEEPVAVAIKKKDQHHLIFGHLVQEKALGRRNIVFIDHDLVESDSGYLSHLIRENNIRYVIWDSALPLCRELVNGSIRQDYSLGNGLWHIFTFASP